MERVPTGCTFDRKGTLIPLHRITSTHPLPYYYDEEDVCWTRRLYFHPLSLKKLLLAFADQFERDIASADYYEVESTNACAAGHLTLDSPEMIVEVVRSACEQDDLLFMGIFFLYFYTYFPPAKKVMSQEMDEVLTSFSYLVTKTNSIYYFQGCLFPRRHLPEAAVHHPPHHPHE